MKINKKLFYVTFISVLVISSIPNYTLAVETFSDDLPQLTAGNQGEYLMVYIRNSISVEEIYDRNIFSRNIRKTPTEFQTIENNDTLVTPLRFILDDITVYINKTAIITFNEITYLFMAAHEMISGNLTFLATETTDNGRSWSDLSYFLNTTLAFDDFYNFDVAYKGENLYLAYSYSQTVNKTKVFNIAPEDYTVLSETQAGNYFGVDFKLYPYDGRIYILSTEPFLKQQVRITYTTIGFGFEGPTLLLDAPQLLTDEFNPTMVRWNNGFFMAAHDKLNDEFNLAQNITFDEYYLWGAWFEDVDEPNSIEYHTVVRDTADGYFRKDPSLEVYEGRIFLSYQYGEGSRFGSAGTPDITFAFSADSKTWTNDFIGKISVFLNPGAYFVIATIGCFALVVPSLFFYNKYKKGK
ncbi:MAG: hypothetical protein GPJ51_13555 [Candidatus Heimdallarchaeota archaeon]|nr:hypothetical protein [Candidatus Heimdallarchaeota archaeon]